MVSYYGQVPNDPNVRSPGPGGAAVQVLCNLLHAEDAFGVDHGQQLMGHLLVTAEPASEGGVLALGTWVVTVEQEEAQMVARGTVGRTVAVTFPSQHSSDELEK